MKANRCRVLRSLSVIFAMSALTGVWSLGESIGDLSVAHAYPNAQPNAPAMPKPMSKAPPSSMPTARPSSMPSSRPSVPRGQNPGVHPSSQPSAGGQGQANAAGFIFGEINIDDSLKAKVKAGSVLFVIVRRFVPQGQGMLIAATKLSGITADSFPLRYVVKQSDAMMGAPLNGRVTVSARIDQDGDAISKQPGDIIGKASQAVIVGINPVAFKLDSAL